MNPEFITQPEPPVLLVSLVKTEPLAVIKNEPPEPEIVEITIDDILDSSDEESVLDIKDIDIVYPLCEDSIKSETVETKYSESVKTEAFIENIIESESFNETENSSDGNDQGNLETDGQQVHNFSNGLNGINVRSPKPEHPKKVDFADRRTHNTTASKEIKKKIKIIKAPVIPVKSHEYITLGKNKHVCNHCQQTYTTLYFLKLHIRRKHREVTTMYQCLYCSFKSKWRASVRLHIMSKHNGDNLRYCCDKCTYKTYRLDSLKKHKLNNCVCFYCYHCCFKSKQKGNLKTHISRHFRREEIKFDCYVCDFMTPKRDIIIKHLKKHRTKSDEAKCKYQLENHTEIRYHYCDKCDFKTCHRGHLKRHKLNHLKPNETPYFYCYHCSFKSKQKGNLKTHILGHFQREETKFDCHICDFMTLKRDMIIKHLKKHSKHRTESDKVKCK